MKKGSRVGSVSILVIDELISCFSSFLRAQKQQDFRSSCPAFTKFETVPRVRACTETVCRHLLVERLSLLSMAVLLTLRTTIPPFTLKRGLAHIR